VPAPIGADAPGLVAINGRAAVRDQIGGVERYAREMALRLPALRPDRYRVIAPPASLAHRAGHAWEQAVLPVLAARCALLYSPANLAPVGEERNVVVVHDVAALRHPEAYSRTYVAYQRQILPLVARRARALITVSEFSRAELVELLGVTPGAIRVIPPGVDQRVFAPADPAPALERYELRRAYVLALGTVSLRKNLRVLEPAARALGERGIDLLLAGSDRGYLRDDGAPLRRLGYVPEPLLPPLYSGARALAMPSLHEGFGLPCLEAMACGTPVVAAARGALPETVGDAALLADPQAPGEFAEALLAAASDESVRSRLTRAGTERAGRYTWEDSVARTDGAIRELLGPRERNGPNQPGRCSERCA
jgi:glycosyltransferase involved in cell wall biosynthesis